MRRAATLVFLFAAAAHVSARPQAAPAAKNACQLLTGAEIAAVQGERFTDAKLTTLDNRSQCFYQLPTFVKSVSVDLIGGNARAYWREHFASKEKEEAKEPREGEESEEGQAPERVRGLGSEAFWAGSRVAGSLYVLKGNAILRVSVGGPGSESEKLARSKRLARNALRRMR
jgi:hypothetical protein